MRKEYIKPAISIAVVMNEQAMLVGTNPNNWAEGKEQDIIEDDGDSYKKIDVSYEDMGIKKLWDDENT